MYTNIINLLSKENQEKVNSLFDSIRNDEVWCVSKTTATGRDGKVSAPKYTFDEACEVLKKSRNGGFVSHKDFEYTSCFELDKYGVSKFDITAPFRYQIEEIRDIVELAATYHREYNIVWRDDEFSCKWGDNRIRYFWKDEKSGTVYELKIKLRKDEVIRDMFLAVKDAQCTLINRYNKELERLHIVREYLDDNGNLVRYATLELIGALKSEDDIPTDSISYILAEGYHVIIDGAVFVFKKETKDSFPILSYIGELR